MVDNAQMLSDALAEIKQLKTKLAALEAQEPVDAVAVEDMDAGTDWRYGRVLMATENCIKQLYAAAGAAPVPQMTGAALASQEPVAEVLLVDGEKVIDASMAFFDSVELGTKLYLAAGAAPAISNMETTQAIKQAIEAMSPLRDLIILRQAIDALQKVLAAGAAPGQQVFGGRVDPSYVNGPMEAAAPATKVPEVGESSFESWYQGWLKGADSIGPKQAAREAYAAGAAPAVKEQP